MKAKDILLMHSLLGPSVRLQRYAEETFGCSVKSVATNNAANIKKMRRALEEEDDFLVTFGCLAHWLNLLGQDCTPASIMKHVMEVHCFLYSY